MTSTISGHYPLINPRPSYWIILPHSLPGSSSSGRRKTTQVAKQRVLSQASKVFAAR